MLSDEYRYKILRLLEKDPQLSQRSIADALDVSLGKVNYCLQALIEKGFIKARNFRNSSNKKAYMYYLTPKGIEHKARVTARFFARKLAEHEALTREIESLRAEVLGVPDPADGNDASTATPEKAAHG
jgi:EPS-associated MarR family transcriptional regulator